jgi:hypothetical protein
MLNLNRLQWRSQSPHCLRSREKKQARICLAGPRHLGGVEEKNHPRCSPPNGDAQPRNVNRLQLCYVHGRTINHLTTEIHKAYLYIEAIFLVPICSPGGYASPLEPPHPRTTEVRMSLRRKPTTTENQTPGVRGGTKRNGPANLEC